MNGRRLVVASALLVATIFLASLHSKNLTCQEFYRNDTTLQVNSQILKAEAAKTPDQLARGLGGRACIGPNQAMLFEFAKPGTYPFWMKDMRFAIDMVWLSADHNVVYEQTNISPATYPKMFVNTTPAQYVLEIQAGRAAQLGLTSGTNVQF